MLTTTKTEMRLRMTKRLRGDGSYDNKDDDDEMTTTTTSMTNMMTTTTKTTGNDGDNNDKDNVWLKYTFGGGGIHNTISNIYSAGWLLCNSPSELSPPHHCCRPSSSLSSSSSAAKYLCPQNIYCRVRRHCHRHCCCVVVIVLVRHRHRSSSLYSPLSSSSSKSG